MRIQVEKCALRSVHALELLSTNMINHLLAVRVRFKFASSFGCSSSIRYEVTKCVHEFISTLVMTDEIEVFVSVSLEPCCGIRVALQCLVSTYLFFCVSRGAIFDSVSHSSKWICQGASYTTAYRLQ